MNSFYAELVFWLTTAAGVLGVVSEALTGYPGDLVGSDLLLIMGIVQTSMTLVAAAVLRRIMPPPTS